MSKAPLRVLQLIDSLEAGGSERMAVQIANLLNDKINFSAIVSTRQSGVLEKDIIKNVLFLCLNKKRAFDIFAVLKLYRFIKKNRINIIHAHGTSFFTAFQLKLFVPSLKLIWHDHYGNSDFLERREKFVLSKCSHFFDAIISVNKKLKDWSIKNLNCRKVFYLENFSSLTEINSKQKQAVFTILQIANLRPQKDHLNSLNAIKLLIGKGHQIQVNYVGDATLNQTYTNSILDYVNYNHLNNTVKFFGSQSNISEFLEKADLGILSSESEGLPLSLLEYAQAHLPVVVTNVGQCKEVVGDNGVIVEPKRPKLLAKAIESYMNNKDLCKKHGDKFYQSIKTRYGADIFLDKLFEVYNTK
jgi:glycosyltransferase involved in cell wall biosynthesis